MGNIIDRTGEENLNNFGSKMVITEYRGALDIDVYFPEYNWTFKNGQYYNFKNGSIKCPYEKRYYDIGYLSEGKYKVSENGKSTKCYIAWYDMLRRCYDPKFHEKNPTYKECEVDEGWYNLQSFGDWFADNYYEIENEKMCLDKEILNKDNKVYSLNACIFVPHNINTLFIKCDKSRGEYPIGVYYDKRDKKFRAQCSIYDFKERKRKTIYLGYYDTPEKAFEVYKKYKENHIREVADYYKKQIPERLYQALYEYEVEIND